MSVNIPEDILKRVLKVVGYPIVTIEDFTTNNMTLDDLREIVLRDGLAEYFSWIPAKSVNEYNIGTTFEIDFPDEETYGVIDYRVILYQNSAVGRTGSVFLDAVTTNQYGSTYGGGAFGTKYNYDMQISRSWERLSRQSVADEMKTLRVNVDTVNRKITGYNSWPGKLNITWAKNSTDWDAVPSQHQQIAIKLMQSELLSFLGQTRAQLEDDSPAKFNWETMVDQAEKLKEECIDYLKNIPKVCVLRS